MFSRKSLIYKDIHNDLVLELHKQGILSLRLNMKIRLLCIISIIISVLTPWYYKNTTWSIIYHYMICQGNLIPQQCISYVALHNSCTLDSSTCSTCNTDMKAGLLVISCSLLSILLHLISYINTRSYITGNGCCKNNFFSYSAAFVYTIGFGLWVAFSNFKMGDSAANYGLTAAFTAIFMNFFAAFHLTTFKNFLLDYYSVEPSNARKSRDPGFNG